MLLLRFHPQSQEVQSCSRHLRSTCCYLCPAVVWTWKTVSIHTQQFKCIEPDDVIYSVKRLGKNRRQRVLRSFRYNPTTQQQRSVFLPLMLVSLFQHVTWFCVLTWGLRLHVGQEWWGYNRKKSPFSFSKSSLLHKTNDCFSVVYVSSHRCYHLSIVG